MRDSTKLLIGSYATDGSAGFQSCAVKLGRDELVASFVEVLSLYFNDPESSKLRFLATLFVAGYEPNEAKFTGSPRRDGSEGILGKMASPRATRRKKGR